MSIISIKNLIHEFKRHNEEGDVTGTFAAVNDVSLEVNAGELIAVLGRNGSGKSTLAKHINALLYPTKGKVYVSGNDTEDDEHLLDIRKSAGMVFQNPDNQIIATVVEEDVAFGPENIGIPTSDIRIRVDEALASVGMSDHALSNPGKLSGGQKQRVAIAGVLAMKPACIILDEPTAMLDPVGRKEVLEAVKKLNRENGMTVILVTHHMDEVTGFDRLIIMDEGKVVMNGTPREVFSDIEKIKEYGLDVPQVCELAGRLGMGPLLEVEEFVAEFKKLAGGRKYAVKT